MPKAPSKPKHQPIPELVKAMSMPDAKRRGAANRRRKKETGSSYMMGGVLEVHGSSSRVM
jgi:hypothetical protein